MPEFDKNLTAKAFQVPGKEKIECIILVATDAYVMGINNPDIRLVVQWDLPINFDSMIQRMGRAGRRGGQATFILFTPKWTQVKDATKVEQRIAKRTEVANANFLLSDSNRPKVDPKQSRLGQVIEAADEQSDAELAAGSELDEFDDPATNALFDLVATEAEEDLNAKRAKKQASKTDAEKRAKLPDELFNYIHAAQCRKLFFLAWYNDLTYTLNVDGSKTLPELCCNGPSCNSKEHDFLERPPFINTTPAKFNEATREWIAYRTAELRKWRKATLKSFWLEQNVETEIPDTLLMSDACLVTLVKAANGLVDCVDGSKVKEFLQPWYGLDNYAEDLFLLLSQSPTKAARKEALKAARALKKAKGLDDPVVAMEARITALQDQWLIKQNKVTPALKARLKKAEKAEKVEKARLEKNREKAREHAQKNDVRRLALANRQVEIGIFQDHLSDPFETPHSPTATVLPSSDSLTPIRPSAATQQSVQSMQAIALQNQSKKRAAAKARGSNLRNRLRKSSATTADPPSPPVQMELIWPGKRRVKVPANAVESTPSKRMRVVS